MNKIALKTAKRNTSVTRTAVREAVTGVFIDREDSKKGVAERGRKGTLRKVKRH